MAPNNVTFIPSIGAPNGTGMPSSAASMDSELKNSTEVVRIRELARGIFSKIDSADWEGKRRLFYFDLKPLKLKLIEIISKKETGGEVEEMKDLLSEIQRDEIEKIRITAVGIFDEIVMAGDREMDNLPLALKMEWNDKLKILKEQLVAIVVLGKTHEEAQEVKSGINAIYSEQPTGRARPSPDLGVHCLIHTLMKSINIKPSEQAPAAVRRRPVDPFNPQGDFNLSSDSDSDSDSDRNVVHTGSSDPVPTPDASPAPSKGKEPEEGTLASLFNSLKECLLGLKNYISKRFHDKIDGIIGLINQFRSEKENTEFAKKMNSIIEVICEADKWEHHHLEKLVELNKKVEILIDELSKTEESGRFPLVLEKLRGYFQKIREKIEEIRSDEELKKYKDLFEESERFLADKDLQNEVRYARLSQELGKAIHSLKEGRSRNLIDSYLRRIEDVFFLRLRDNTQRKNFYTSLEDYTTDPIRVLSYLAWGREVGNSKVGEGKRMDFLYSGEGKLNQSKIIEYQKFFDTLANPSTKRKDLKKNLEDRIKEVGSLQGRIDEIKELDAEIEKLHSTFLDLDIEKNSQERKADELSKEIKKNEEMLGQKKLDREKRIREFEFNKDLYAMQGVDGKKVIDAEEEEIRRLEQEISSLAERGIDSPKQELADVHQTIEILSGSIEKINRERNSYSRRSGDLKQINGQFYQLSDLESDLVGLKDEAKMAKGKLYILENLLST